MRRLTITLEDYDDSKIVRSALFEHDDDISTTASMLSRTSVPFSIEEVTDELYDYVLDDGSRYVELSLRTKDEIKKWTYREPFERCIEGFLESFGTGLQLSLTHKETSLTITRRCQVMSH